MLKRVFKVPKKYYCNCTPLLIFFFIIVKFCYFDLLSSLYLVLFHVTQIPKIMVTFKLNFLYLLTYACIHKKMPIFVQVMLVQI